MEEVNIPSDIHIKCGYCNKDLGTLEELMSSNILGHKCLKDFNNVSLDLENKRLWGLGPAEKKEENVKTVDEDSIPGCSKDIDNIETEIQSSNFLNKDYWTYETTKFLINAYKENKHKFESPQYNKKAVWEVISKEMRKLKVYKPWDKISEKWRNLKKTYDKILKEKNSTGNSGGIHWTFFEEFHEIYFKDPHFNPHFTISSTGSFKKRNLSETESSSCIEENKEHKNKKLKDKVLPEASTKKTHYTSMDIENRRQQRHEEKMKQRQEIFEWFKDNVKKD